MRDTQPDITNDQELASYSTGLLRFDEIVAPREAARLTCQGDTRRLTAAHAYPKSV